MLGDRYPAHKKVLHENSQKFTVGKGRSQEFATRDKRGVWRQMLISTYDEGDMYHVPLGYATAFGDRPA